MYRVRTVPGQILYQGGTGSHTVSLSRSYGICQGSGMVLQMDLRCLDPGILGEVPLILSSTSSSSSSSSSSIRHHRHRRRHHHRRRHRHRHHHHLWHRHSHHHRRHCCYFIYTGIRYIYIYISHIKLLTSVDGGYIHQESRSWVG